MWQWITIAPQFLLLLAILIVPGFPWVRAFVRSSVVAVAAAPAVGMFVVAALAVVYHALGIPWGLPRVGPALLVVGALGLVVWRIVAARHPLVRTEISDHADVRPPLRGAVPASRAYRHMTRSSRIAAAICLALGWIIAILPMIVAAKPDDPFQQWDSTFHLNGVWWMIQQGNGSVFGGLATMYGGNEGMFYPDGWHAWVALASTMTTVIQAANASTLALMAIWVVGCAGFTAVLTNSRVAVLAAPIIAGCLPNMPADALTMYNQWPHATAVALTPGIAAIVTILGRRLWRATERSVAAVAARIPFALVCVAAVAGGLIAHPGIAFSLVVLFIAPVIATLAGGIRRGVRIGDIGGAVAVAVALAVVVIAPLLALASPRLASMGRYPRNGYDWAFALQRAFTPFPPFATKIGLFLTVFIVAALAILGALASFTMAATWRRHARLLSSDWASSGRYPADLDDRSVPLAQRRGLSRRFRQDLNVELGSRPLCWPVVAFLLFSVIVLLAYGPNSEIRTFFTAPWYMDARRIMAYQDIPLVVIAAFGFERAVNWVRSQRVRTTETDGAASSMWRIGAILGAWLLAATLIGGLDARLWAVRYVADPDNLGKPGMATSQELEMLRRMPQTLPEDAVVIGDPIAGAAYTEVIGQRLALYPQLTIEQSGNAEGQKLAQTFNQIHSDPAVCQLLAEEGVTHYYEDADGYYYNFLRSSRYPGLYNVDTSTGFELVDEGDQARLWRITACD